jgi:hypothetical protein
MRLSFEVVQSPGMKAHVFFPVFPRLKLAGPHTIHYSLLQYRTSKLIIRNRKNII